MNFHETWWLHPLIIPIVFLILLILQYVKVKRWPEMDKCVEIIAFSAGTYMAFTMFKKAFITFLSDQSIGWGLFAGAVVITLASVRGTWLVFSSIKPRYKPQNNLEGREPGKNPETDGER